MKKFLLFLATAMFSATASAQFTIWEDDFNDSNVSDWILLDLDGNGSNWFARTDLQLDPITNTIANGTQKILGNYNIDFSTLGPLLTAENNWAISPAIDLSYYGGTISLILNAQTAIYNQDLPVEVSIYASTSQQQSTFTQISTFTINRVSMTDLELADYTIPFSQFSGQAEVYFAMVVNNSNGFIGVEVNNVKIDATEILDRKDHDKVANASVILQNPVDENLKLQLSPALNIDKVNLQIYSMTGMLVSETKFNPTGIPVSNLASGIYIAVLNDGNATERLKFIKK